MAYPVDPDKQKLAQQIQRDIQSEVPIDPELMEYAESIMPSLKPQKVLPDNYNSLAQKEALSQQNSQLPSNYNELAQDEANQQNPLPSNYNELAQKEADEQDKFSEPMRLEKTPEEIKAYKEKMRRFYPYDESFQEKEYEIPDTLKRPEQNTLTPEMRDYAYDIFPALEEIVPRRVNTTKEFEGKTADGLLKKEEAPKQKSPSTIKTPINEITKIVEKRKPSGAEEPSIDDMIKNIRSEQDRVALSKQSAKLRDAIMGAGIGQLKQTDVSRYEELAKRAERPLTDMLLKTELKDKQAKNDPNSNISKLMRKSLEKLDVDMTGFEGVSAAQLEKLYPNLVNGITAKINAEARRDIAQLGREDRAILRQQKEDLKKAAAAKLSDKQLTPLVDVDSIIANLDNVISTANEKFVGPLDARIPDTLTSGENAAFRSSVGRMVDAYRKAITGAGASAMELQKLESRLPQTTDTLEQFKAKALSFRKELIRNRTTYLKTLKKQGKDVSEWETSVEAEEELTPEERLKVIEEQISKNNKRLEELRSKR